MIRPTIDQYFMTMAYVAAARSTCIRRHVGCVLVDAHRRVLSTGFNGVPRDFRHCNDGHPCLGAEAPSGEKLEACLAIHAEQNALLQCPDTEKIDRCYVTSSPCIHCMKLLLNTSCRTIVYGEVYDEAALALWSDRAKRVALYEKGVEDCVP